MLSNGPNIVTETGLILTIAMEQRVIICSATF